MNDKVVRFLDSLKDDAKGVIKKELGQLLDDAHEDADDFVKKQRRKLENYIEQLADEKITKAEFEGYVTDLKTLTEMEALKMSASSKIRAQSLAMGIENVVIKGLIRIL